MKKTYMKPALMVVRVQQQGIICTSFVDNIDGDVDLDYGGGGNGSARAPEYGELDLDDFEW